MSFSALALADYSVHQLARAARTSVRNIRAYQDRGLLPPPQRRGRTVVYNDEHLASLRVLGRLLARGYSLANIKELLAAWRRGDSLDAVLGVPSRTGGPWSEETAGHMTVQEIFKLFGAENDPGALAQTVEFGLLEPQVDGFRVPSPRELAVGATLHAAGMPLREILDQLRLLRQTMEKLAVSFVDAAAKHVLPRHLRGKTPPRPAKIAALVQLFGPLAQSAVEVELMRALKIHATQRLEALLGPTQTKRARIRRP